MFRAKRGIFWKTIENGAKRGFQNNTTKNYYSTLENSTIKILLLW